MAKLTMEDVLEVFKHLDVTCWQCNGSGKALAHECDVCHGTGYQPTGAGIELLNFLRRQKKRIEREFV